MSLMIMQGGLHERCARNDLFKHSMSAHWNKRRFFLNHRHSSDPSPQAIKLVAARMASAFASCFCYAHLSSLHGRQWNLFHLSLSSHK